mmetsp:Transcript_26606/g.56220  ORF Transcript_26606/g.56220 Transcript_26606/m.56220 type:complete len:245 (+) Transcript_26606:308-1042(+)|eukprot:CAMPEP_0183721420 /NCGR_PEP_ID=MMETSP0737-20130205/13703_1 /TAXON_ID=385413 /ORGANISM="Thalassiosira miniscula, Strain CCMP1093" /LENGTH=244 /DNA_ID=CAMNT_0025951427 /DNA_START=236 /DNA_END=970 /DNA_ORIENTATION=-
MPKSKPKILCLHGAGSNNDITSFQMQGLQLASHFECVYLHAPHMSKQCHLGLDSFAEGPWYLWADRVKSLSDQEDQWEESLEYIAKFCKKNGPFLGVYAFSQGAAIITNFSHPKIWKERFRMTQCPWKFAILACSGDKHNMTIGRDTTINMPSFHIFGKKDRLLVKSKEVAQYWDSSGKVTHTHEGGHGIDVQMHTREKEMMKKLNDFVGERLSSSKGLGGIFSNLSVPEFFLLGYSFGGSSSK